MTGALEADVPNLIKFNSLLIEFEFQEKKKAIQLDQNVTFLKLSLCANFLSPPPSGYLLGRFILKSLEMLKFLYVSHVQINNFF